MQHTFYLLLQPFCLCAQRTLLQLTAIDRNTPTHQNPMPLLHTKSECFLHLFLSVHQCDRQNSKFSVKWPIIYHSHTLNCKSTELCTLTQCFHIVPFPSHFWVRVQNSIQRGGTVTDNSLCKSTELCTLTQSRGKGANKKVFLPKQPNLCRLGHQDLKIKFTLYTFNSLHEIYSLKSVVRHENTP